MKPYANPMRTAIDMYIYIYIYICIHIYLVGRENDPDVCLSFSRMTSSIVKNYKKKRKRFVFACSNEENVLLSLSQIRKESFVGLE